MDDAERRLYTSRPWMLPENSVQRCSVPTKHRGDQKRCCNRVEHDGRCAVHLRLARAKIASIITTAIDLPGAAVLIERRERSLAVVLDKVHLTDAKEAALLPVVAKLGRLMREAGADRLTVLTA